MIGDNIVGIHFENIYEYPGLANDFRPSIAYPETPFSEISKEDNRVYEAVRNTLWLMGYDRQNFGSRNWNPLKDFISPGMTVLIKPNLVMDKNKSGNGTDCLFTNPSVVAAVIDYVYIALSGTGRIVVGDAPVQECNFDNLICNSGYKVLVEYYQKKGINIDLVDFRGAISVENDGIYMLTEGEEKGIVVDLGKDSEFYTLDEAIKRRLRITNYNPDNVINHHMGEKNELYISKYVLDADVVINVPKPKTHRIAGMTGALKNFVGANVRKEYLPHHTMGSFKTGGDESNSSGIILNARAYCLDKKNRAQDKNKLLLAKIWLFGVRLFSFAMNGISQYRDGCWYGNNTISKTINDINKIIYYADKGGIMRVNPQRTVLVIADMIQCGEGNGPLNPTRKNVGAIAIATNPICFDEIIASLMGFDIKKIPTLVLARNKRTKYQIIETEEPKMISNREKYNGMSVKDITRNDSFNFVPSSGWTNHIEMEKYRNG